MVNWYLVRHAEAELAAADGSDASRPLTPRGAKRFKQEVQALKALGLSLDRIYHSPLLRAVETAELMLPLLGAGHETVVTPHLAEPPGDALLREVQGDSVALVGHNPWMAELLALLMTRETRMAGRFAFKKGAVAWLEGEPQPGGMVLRAFLPPGFLRKSG